MARSAMSLVLLAALAATATANFSKESAASPTLSKINNQIDIVNDPAPNFTGIPKDALDDKKVVAVSGAPVAVSGAPVTISGAPVKPKKLDFEAKKAALIAALLGKKEKKTAVSGAPVTQVSGAPVKTEVSGAPVKEKNLVVPVYTKDLLGRKML